MVSLFEMFLLWLAIGVPMIVAITVAHFHGSWNGVGIGLLSAMVSIPAAGVLFRTSQIQSERQRRELREKFRGIYRVIVVPTDERSIMKPDGAQIKVGDYGWEATPLWDDGLIYLQGLNPQWRVVWYAGFRPHEIESVVLKPQSQYDWYSDWFRNAPPCPFPVQERQTTDMGLPIPVRTKRATGRTDEVKVT